MEEAPVLALFDHVRQFDLLTVCLRLLAAFLLGGIIGMERGRRGRAAGLRTHILVCLGATMTTLTGLFVNQILSLSSDPLRVGAQVISGIGFLGVGTILVTGRTHVRGLTTAAGLWNTAAIGLALGVGFYEAALACTALSVLTIIPLNRVEKALLGKNSNVEVYIEINSADRVNAVVRALSSPEFGISHMEVKPAHSGIADNVGIEGVLHLTRHQNVQDVMDRISQMPEVAFAVENC
ncbi:MAG: MgtC/SapB family protein [Eubacteriales bacterium]|nr:MgtC/SapB family protein [Eubacteriales bacterium]